MIRADDLDAENTLDAPERVVPRRREPHTVGNRFDWILEGNSFSVLTLTPQS
jgi:alpha-L-arabinofuranosidase